MTPGTPMTPADAPRQLTGFDIEPKPPKPTKRDKRIAKRWPGLAKKPKPPQQEQHGAIAQTGCYAVDAERWIHRPWHAAACSKCRGAR